MRVLIIGANGQLGFDLMRAFGEEAIGITHADLEITNSKDVWSYLEKLRPEWVINTAAFHNVEKCETGLKGAQQSFAVNSLGALDVATASKRIGASSVFISTDYVFDGRKGTPYVESDKPCPINIYGCSKLAGENHILEEDKKALIIRASGLYGINGSRKGHTFPEFILKRMKLGNKLDIVDDQVFSPTCTVDLATAIKELVCGGASGLYHVTNSGDCTWYEFALAVCKMAKVEPALTPVLTKEYMKQSGIKANRPLFSVLETEKKDTPILCEWEEALERYLIEKEII